MWNTRGKHTSWHRIIRHKRTQFSTSELARMDFNFHVRTLSSNPTFNFPKREEEEELTKKLSAHLLLPWKLTAVAFWLGEETQKTCPNDHYYSVGLAWLGLGVWKRKKEDELQYVREGKKRKEMLSFFGNWAEDLRETRSRQKRKDRNWRFTDAIFS